MKISFKINYTSKKAICFVFEVFRKTFKPVIEIKPKLEPKIQNNIADRNYDKIFCIGFGKTGTTSLEKALAEFGFNIGNQGVAEILSEDWASKNSNRIINFCRTAEAFQDMPFGLPKLYIDLDKAFPNSKFILTVRDDEKQWINSLKQFHAKLFSKDKTKPPTEDDLKNALYRYKGWLLKIQELFFNYPEVALYDEQYYTQKYLTHNSDVKKYFEGRENDLLILNVSQKDSYQRLAIFLKMKVEKEATFPWLNKT
jgi:hypothetical protein